MAETQKPLIGITGAEIFNREEPWSPVTFGQSSFYVSAVIHAGGLPIILPLLDSEADMRALYARCDAILFAGGNDPHPRLYGEEPDHTVTDVSVFRDTVEMRLMKWSLEDKLPILGICRGMELLNIAREGSLYQDIPQFLPAASNHNLSNTQKDVHYLAHKLTVQAGSKLAVALGVTSVGTNTHHHQAVKKLGDGLQAVAWAEDGVIEAIEDPRMPFVVGVQSHPESLEAETVPEWQGLFKAFVSQAAKGR